MNDGAEVPVFGFGIANLDFGLSCEPIESDDNIDDYKGFSHTIELSASVENMKDVDEILAGDNTFDIVIKEEYSGIEYKRERQEILTTLVIFKRIPRKMKKSLKKRYGDMWKYHHPNVNTEVVIRDKR